MLWLLLACVQSDLDSGEVLLDCSQACSLPDCEEDPACEELPSTKDYRDGLDNHGDGDTDYADADCSLQLAACSQSVPRIHRHTSWGSIGWHRTYFQIESLLTELWIFGP
ncbi:MAG: hypothetical protein ACI9VR_004605 [Cognaticolwellia sp.]|jgi:hypothetical protein